MSRLQFQRVDSGNSFEELNINDKKLINLRGGLSMPIYYQPPCVEILPVGFPPDLKPGERYCPIQMTDYFRELHFPQVRSAKR